ncbi:site-specific integrase [Luteolibacter sp. SL250]|uniref:site-specific integrase n=1 Tax=Luteolibacter sp. SL250 TaxID=2995170 RepID=UPI00226DB6F8|nr:site-specific integrase [Luteolibacter sp. SL250]WAC21111.1 site-specific integrase [Luteolibacter sp. SL250]
MVSTGETTRRAYVTAFRAIVADIASIPRTGFKPNQRNEKIDKVSLQKVTREAIQKWIATGTRKCTTQSDRRTIRSRFVNAKSLFHKNALEAFNRTHNITLVSPFTDITLPKTAPVRHFSKVELGQLIEMAKVDLSGSTTDFEQWQILILVISAGLRRNEVDKLRWADIDLKAQKLHIRDAEGHTLKTHCSVGSISLDARTCELIAGWKPLQAPVYVISEARHPSMKHMRCGDHFNRLCQWLRNVTVDGEKPLANVQKPLHELRKEAGSRVNELHGLHEACRFLRHTSINTTSDYYLNSDNVTVGMDALIEGEQQTPANTSGANDPDEDILFITNDGPTPKSIRFVP